MSCHLRWMYTICALCCARHPVSGSKNHQGKKRKAISIHMRVQNVDTYSPESKQNRTVRNMKLNASWLLIGADKHMFRVTCPRNITLYTDVRFGWHTLKWIQDMFYSVLARTGEKKERNMWNITFCIVNDCEWESDSGSDKVSRYIYDKNRMPLTFIHWENMDRCCSLVISPWTFVASNEEKRICMCCWQGNQAIQSNQKPMRILLHNHHEAANWQKQNLLRRFSIKI